MTDKKEKNSNFSELVSAYRKAAPYINSVYTILASIALFGLIGWWLDGYFDSKPVLIICGLMVGFFVGFYSFFRGLSKLEKKGDEN